jgi:predicted nucleic acid-binding protein
VIVVADATPLLYLSRIRRLDIARALYVQVLVPREVHEELVERRPDADGVKELRAAEWIVVVDAPASIPVDESPLAVLDAGEAAALRLAFERRALVLIDERAGRRVAHSLGLAVRGTLGTLVEARLRGVVEAVGPILTELERHGFRASPELRAWALQAAGEVAR